MVEAVATSYHKNTDVQLNYLHTFNELQVLLLDNLHCMKSMLPFSNTCVVIHHTQNDA